MGHVRSRSVRAPRRGSDDRVHAAVLRGGHRVHDLPGLPRESKAIDYTKAMISVTASATSPRPSCLAFRKLTTPRSSEDRLPAYRTGLDTSGAGTVPALLSFSLFLPFICEENRT